MPTDEAQAAFEAWETAYGEWFDGVEEGADLFGKPVKRGFRAGYRAAASRLAEVVIAILDLGVMNQDEQGGCVYCGSTGKGGGAYGYAGEKIKDHESHCAWVLAVRAMPDEAEARHKERWGARWPLFPAAQALPEPTDEG